MKRRVLLIISTLLMIAVCGCSSSDSTNPETGAESIRINTNDPTRYSPQNSSGYAGMNYIETEALLKQAGFEKIRFIRIDDLDSGSTVPDGSVESVTIAESNEYTTETIFEKDDEVVITYHSIPKAAVPLSSAECLSGQYMEIGKKFHDAGFTNVVTDEVFDLTPGSNSKTEVLADGKEILAGSELAYDSTITVVQHFPIPSYSTVISIDFESNWLFSKYDVIATLDGNELGTMPHGESQEFNVSLPAGTYNLVFKSVKDNSVTGSAVLSVNSNTKANYKIQCHSKEIEVKNTATTYDLRPDKILIPFNWSHYLRKDYTSVAEELKTLGFRYVETKATTDMLWSADRIDSVVKVTIKDEPQFSQSQIFSNLDHVVVYYHVSDFSFSEQHVEVTEKETFDLPYNMTTGDSLDSIAFSIDLPEVLQRNSDGTFTALKPGTAVVTAYCGGDVYSECTVDSAEIIVPIEKLEFASDQFDVSVGSTFKPDYKVIPETANYTDMHVEISNNLIESADDSMFRSLEEGDSEISFYQDERLLGKCTVHSTYYEIEDLVFEDGEAEVFIGETLEVPYKLKPENATNKGVSVWNSNPGVAEISFDEFGLPAISVTGISAGETDITITVPNGAQYTRTVTIKEILPEEIKLTRTEPDQKIEVGTPVSLDIIWKPQTTSIKEVTWVSSDPSVIRIDNEGNLETVGVGTADITATHHSGLTGTTSITVEPTPVKSVQISTTRNNSEKLYAGSSFQISASVSPENATDQTLQFSSSNEAVAQVNQWGVVTAVGAGDANIIVESPDGPKKSVPITVSPAPQMFRIDWSAYLAENHHVGGNWSREFTVNGETWYSGSTIVLDPDSSFQYAFIAQENDKVPDYGSYSEEIVYSDDLCKNGYSVTIPVYVTENSGRYSGDYALWNLTVTVTPVY